MGFCSVFTRVLLAILNILLFVAFLAIAVVGFLLKFNEQILVDLIQKAAKEWPKIQAEQFVTLLQSYGTSAAIVLIVLGLFVAVVALIGIIALFCKVRFLAGIYIAILAILSAVELGLIIYAFAIPDNLYNLVHMFMNDTLHHISKNDSLSNASLDLWCRIGSSGNQSCCGLDGIQDFGYLNGNESVPTSCCLQNYSLVLNQTETYNCTYEMAFNYSQYRDISGCRFKIDNWLDSNKVLLVAVPCSLFAFQLIVLIIVIILCVAWGKDIY